MASAVAASLSAFVIGASWGLLVEVGVIRLRDPLAGTREHPVDRRLRQR